MQIEIVIRQKEKIKRKSKETIKIRPQKKEHGGINLVPLGKHKTEKEGVIRESGHTFPFHVKGVSLLTVVGIWAVCFFRNYTIWDIKDGTGKQKHQTQAFYCKFK